MATTLKTPKTSAINCKRVLQKCASEDALNALFLVKARHNFFNFFCPTHKKLCFSENYA
jgi:hypothetical protein